MATLKAGKKKRKDAARIERQRKIDERRKRKVRRPRGYILCNACKRYAKKVR